MKAFSKLCFWVAGGAALAGSTRFGHWAMTHPQPKVGFFWLIGAGISLLVGILLWPNKAPTTSAAPRR